MLAERETQAGGQRRRKEQDIDQDRLMDQLAAVHSVEDRDLAGWLSAPLASIWTKARRLSGRMRLVVMTTGSSAAPTRPVCDAE